MVTQNTWKEITNIMRHMLNPLDFSLEETDNLLELAADIEKDRSRYAHVCDGKKLATLFYEPSTRTRLSFEAAMLNLGGSVLGFASADSRSATKGESVSDTIRVISCYADICAMRHPKEGAAYVASTKSSIPVINAGDGGHQHPTQTLTDLYIKRDEHAENDPERRDDAGGLGYPGRLSLRKESVWPGGISGVSHWHAEGPLGGTSSGGRVQTYREKAPREGGGPLSQ